MPSSDPPEVPSWSRSLLEFGPVLLFFTTNWVAGIYWATGVFMAAIVLSLAWSWTREKRVPPLMVVTGIAVLVFGSLTLLLHDDTFIKIKVTVLNALLGLVLLAGELLGRPLLRPLLGGALQLTDRGWRLFSLRYAAFFLVLAAVNEVVWRTQSTSAWVAFKSFGLIGLTFLFTLLQMPLLQRHQPPREGGPA